MPTIQIINPLTYPLWDDLVLTNENYSFFHTSAWAKVLSESYSYKPLYFSLFKNNYLQALIPIMEVNSYLTGRRGVALPFSDFSDPIFNKELNKEEVFKEIILLGRKRKWKYFEIRGGKLFEDIATHSLYYVNHILDLTQGEEKIFSRISRHNRKNINKAIREGLEVETYKSERALEEFYRLLCITRQKHGVPPQPIEFFYNIHKHVISNDQAILNLVHYQNEIIAAGIFLHLKDKVIFKYGVSDHRYQNLRANNLLTWETIKWYSRNGFKTFSFGKTDPENSGLRRFKLGWATEEEEIKYYKYNFQKNIFVTDKYREKGNYNKLLRRLPIPVLRLIGDLLYKHMG